jgi:SAM-dependent methyltransferase
MMDVSTSSPVHVAHTGRGQSAIRHLRRWVHAWLLDWRAGARVEEKEVALKPFSFWPTHRSKLSGEGGDMDALVAGYAFHTEYVPSTGGRIRFTLQIDGLRATRGRLLLHVNILDTRDNTAKPRTKEYSLAKLAARGGRIDVTQLGLSGYNYALLGILSADSDAQAERIRIFARGGDSEEAMRRRLEAARHDFLAAPGAGILADFIVDRQATMAQPISQMCTAHQMAEPEYAEMCQRMGTVPGRHRKQWEFAFILRTLQYHGAWRDGARGLGFGVGIEPLSSVFAASGCTIVATDLEATDARAQVWDDTDQLGSTLAQIHYPDLCSEADFHERVSFRPVDMNAIPADLRDFDFTWSSCAYEHLGSIKAGLDFFENSLACLKPGGIAVHTTELNLSSNEGTLDNSGTVIFRRRDFEALASRLIEQGHDVMPITFDSGDTELDRFIDLPPYSADSHLKLALLRWVSTSFGLVVRKRAN